MAFRRQGPLLNLTYQCSGDTQAIKLPEPGPVRRQDGLWKHTCFEAFLQKAGDDSYEEYNFSPSGCWAHYRFSGYRQALPESAIAEPRIHCSRENDGFTLSTCIELLHDQGLQLGLSAVLENPQGKLSYWAAKHTKETPDFHEAAGFVIPLK